MMDQYDGIGGSYIADPKTGERTLVERTQESDEVKQPEPAADQPAAAEGD